MRHLTIFKSVFALRSIPALGLAGAVLLTGCSTNSDGSASTPAPTTGSGDRTSTVPTSSDPSTGSVASSAPANSILPPTTPAASASAPASEAVANETIDWEPCGDLECGTVTVPVDREDESLGTLQIAVNVRRATNPDERVGYLFINPGGPGVSGLEYADAAEYVLGEDVTDRFDVIGFDPRGVGKSEPTFACGNDGEQLDLLNRLTLPLDADEVAIGERAARLCTDSMGPVATRMGSAFVADDMDAIRVALGTDKINFLGYSYGSTLGTWYASAYPSHVRAMVLDAASEVVNEDPSQQPRPEGSEAEAAAFEEQMAKALAACDTADCPIYNDGDPTAAYYEAISRQDLVTAQNPSPSTTLFGLITFLYSEEGWPDMWQALADLRDGDPTAIVEAAREQDHHGAASLGETVNCLDTVAIHPIEDRSKVLADVEAAHVRTAEQFPLLGAIETLPVDACPFFDVLDPPAARVTVDGGDVPILVIGNRSDPVTPFAESERLATEVLSNGYLIDTDHFQHTVFPANTCVNEHVYDLLFDERLPETRVVTCEREDFEGQTQTETQTPPDTLPPTEGLPPIEALAVQCAYAVTMFDPQPTADQADEICKRTIESVTTGKSDAELEELADPTKDESNEELSNAFEEAFEAVMGS